PARIVSARTGIHRGRGSGGFGLGSSGPGTRTCRKSRRTTARAGNVLRCRRNGDRSASSRQARRSSGSADPATSAAAGRTSSRGTAHGRGCAVRVGWKGARLVAMTAEVKDELSRLTVSQVSSRKAELSALLRFAGGLHIVGGRVIVEAEVDMGSIARRLRREIFELYGYGSDVHVLGVGGLRKTSRYVVRVSKEGEALARQTGLLDVRGRPVRGLPAQVVGGSIADAEAAWRGAFLAHGSLTEPGRSSALEVSCPGPEAALALVGAARRLGITAKAREVRGTDRVVVRDGEAIGALLTRMGAQDTRLTWEERR